MVADVPDISVVMSVYNNVDSLPAALQSALSQEGVTLELIAINDGSTDASGKILDEAAAKDARVKVIHKPNEGLTKALAEGCALAVAPWIARQDADDVSLPGRLRAQLDRAQQSDAPVLVACGAMVQTPEGIDLFPSVPEGDLTQKILGRIESPCPHGAAFFSKQAYEAAGGYRPDFYYAQDLDLFTRLAKAGPVVAVPDVLYRYTFSPHSISTHAAAAQNQFRTLIRRADASALREAEALSRRIRSGAVRKTDAFAGFYFIGCCLRTKNPRVAADYLDRALALRPWSVRALIRRVQCMGGLR